MEDLKHLREVLTEAYPREELSLDALARVVAALDGLPAAALDGGWTFKGFTAWAQALEADAKRYRWLAARLLAADFDYNGDGVQALVFELPVGCAVSADCNATIDAAMLAKSAVGAA
jgi:hypothetical protein